MNFIKPIETHYKGYRFRSRLEARWAVFFDCLQIRYEYEPEGYTDGKTNYLPDFFLPEFDCFVEIKPYADSPEREAYEKAEMLTKGTMKPVYIMCGEPYVSDDEIKYIGFLVWGNTGDDYYYWCKCHDCGVLGIQYEGRAGRNVHKASCRADKSDKNYGDRHPLLLRAYEQARSARFQ